MYQDLVKERKNRAPFFCRLIPNVSLAQALPGSVGFVLRDPGLN